MRSSPPLPHSEVKDTGLLNLIAQLTGLLLQVEVRGRGQTKWPNNYMLVVKLIIICGHFNRVCQRVVTRWICPL